MSDIKNFVLDRLNDNYYSPDSSALFRFLWTPVFVYGTLKKGFSRHQLLGDCIPVGKGSTRATGWVMYKRKYKHTHPIVLPCGNEEPGAIQGEVYLIRPKTQINLDFVESNGIICHRVLRTIDVILPSQEIIQIPCFMHVGTRAHWAPAIEKGIFEICDLLKSKKNPDKKYYTFMRKYVTDALRDL